MSTPNLRSVLSAHLADDPALKEDTSPTPRDSFVPLSRPRYLLVGTFHVLFGAFFFLYRFAVHLFIELVRPHA